MKEKHSSLKLVLTVLFVVALLISNIVWAKQLGLFGGKIVSTAAIVLFPITYVLSDIFSEVYGYKRSRITCWLWFGANLFMVLIFALTISLPESPFWWNQEAYATILWSTPRMLCPVTSTPVSALSVFCALPVPKRFTVWMKLWLNMKIT